MPTVKKQLKTVKKIINTTSLRAPKGRGNLIKKIASSKIPRNDDKRLASGLSVPVYSLTGRKSGTLSLPKEIFGAKVNKNLLAQAVRVYLANQKKFTSSTKTRGEVTGSTAKIYKQKGTGRARHGSIRAPIFVGGGIVFGPRPRDISLRLPQKMKKASLFSALSSKAADKKVLGLTGLDSASGKTKEIVVFLKKVDPKLSSALIIMGSKQDNIVRAVKNIPGVDVVASNLINTYEVLNHEMLLITKEALENLSGKKEEVRR